MNHFSQLIFVILAVSQATLVYPNPESQQLQWEDQIWVNCNTQQLIIPTICENNDQNWKECYKQQIVNIYNKAIPEEGLCLKNELNILKQSTYNFIFNFVNLNSSLPKILINNNNYEQQQFKNSKIVIQAALKQSSINIKIEGGSAQLQQFILTTDCNLNCKKCEENFECQTCFDDFSLINYKCITDKCFSTISQLTTESALRANSFIDDQGLYQVDVEFNVDLGYCLIPKVYLTNEVNSNKIEFLLENKQIQIHNNKQLQFYLSLEQINSYCKLIVHNKEKNIHQCYISVALTTSQITQYNLIIVGEITTNLQTSSTLSSIQVINIPDDGKVKLEVSNEIEKVQINQDILTITQKIQNDQLKIDNIVLKEAYFIQNGIRYDNLEYLISIVQNQLITYKFKIQETQIKGEEKIELFLQSELQPQRRILLQDRSQLKIYYNTKSSIEFQPNELSFLKTNPKNSSLLNYPIYTITGILLLSLCIAAFWYKKKEKKHYEIGDEKIEKSN